MPMESPRWTAARLKIISAGGILPFGEIPLTNVLIKRKIELLQRGITALKKSHSIDMCNGSLADKILLFALPLMASSLLQLLFNAADVVVVGRFAGKEALAAVGSNTALINLMINLFVGLSVGTWWWPGTWAPGGTTR